MSKYFPKPIVPKPFSEMDQHRDAILDIEKRLDALEGKKNISIASAGICEACCQSPHQYTLKSINGQVDYHVCANCLSRLTNNTLTPTMFFNLIRNGHTTKEFLLHGDFYDDETGEALQPR